MNNKEVNYPFIDLLQKLGCPYEVKEQEKDIQKEEILVYFDYQGGHFIASINGYYYVNLYFMNIYDSSISRMDVVARLCNQINLLYHHLHLVYTVNQEENRIEIHIHCGVHVTQVDEEIKQIVSVLLSAHFQVQRDFILEMEKDQMLHGSEA